MLEIKRLNANIIFPLISDLLEQGIRVRITVTGRSMYPFLRENIDSVELTGMKGTSVNRGDIVLTIRDNGMYVLHRVLRIEKDRYYIIGDAQQWIEGPLRTDQLVAKATTVWRRNRRISCSNIGWKVITILWRLLLPYRNKIIKFLS